MATAYASMVVDATIDQVWPTVRDFDGLPSWHSVVSSSTIEDGAPADQVGCVRALSLDDGGGIRERLLRLDDQNHVLVYTFVESPFPVRRYVATMRLAPVTDQNTTFVEWWADFDAEAADEANLVDTFTNGVFAAGLTGLAAHLSAAR